MILQCAVVTMAMKAFKSRIVDCVILHTIQCSIWPDRSRVYPKTYELMKLKVSKCYFVLSSNDNEWISWCLHDSRIFPPFIKGHVMWKLKLTTINTVRSLLFLNYTQLLRV